MLNENAPKNFTATNNKEAEELLMKVLLEIKELLKDTKLCVVLGGSYGRGDGGVRLDKENGLLYNDLDFFVFAKESTSKDANLLKDIEKKYEEELKIDVDFSRIMTIKDIQNNASRLMMQELKRGYFLVCGKDLLEEYLMAIPHDKLPFSEACRLLFNRGMGLLLAGDEISKKSTNMDFILRNINKAILGSGDAILIGNNQYDWKISNRVKLIENLAIKEEWKKLYQNAVLFKYSPSKVLDKNLNDFYLEAKEFYLFSLLASAKTCDEKELFSSLKNQCQKSKEISLVNYIKYCVKSRSINVKDFSLYCLPAVASILPTLYNEVKSAPALLDKNSKLYKHWLIFN
jgi:predicted nucleotidyltransferase